MQCIRLLCVVLITVLISACGYTLDEKQIPEQLSAVQLYNQTKVFIQKKEYEKAIVYYRTIDTRYPFGDYAQKAQLGLIYSYYQNGEPESSLATADRFIRLHPRHTHVDYAYYMRGLAAGAIGKGFFTHLMPVKMSERDLSRVRDTFDYFAEMVNRFPDSPYAPSARKKLRYLRNLMASREIAVAQFYLRRGAFVAAINRARFVVDNIANSPEVSEALAIMVHCYQKLDMLDAANKTLQKLRTDYPHSPFLTKSGNFVGYRMRQQSFFANLTKELFHKSKDKTPHI